MLQTQPLGSRLESTACRMQQNVRFSTTARVMQRLALHAELLNTESEEAAHPCSPKVDLPDLPGQVVEANPCGRPRRNQVSVVGESPALLQSPHQAQPLSQT